MADFPGTMFDGGRLRRKTKSCEDFSPQDSAAPAVEYDRAGTT